LRQNVGPCGAGSIDIVRGPGVTSPFSAVEETTSTDCLHVIKGSACLWRASVLGPVETPYGVSLWF